MGFPGDSDGKESACNAGDPCSVPGSGRSPGEENGNPYHYTGPRNYMEKDPGRPLIMVCKELDIIEQLILSI